METRANYLLVVIFVLVIVASGAGGAILLLNLHPIPATRAYYDIYFSGSVSGLKTEAPVFLSGIPIGNVRKVALEPEDPTQVHVTIEVRKDAAIRSDSIASLDVSLVFGDATISITGGSESAPPLTILPGHAYPIIGSRPPLVATWATDLVQRTIEVSDTLIKMLDEDNRQAISDRLQSIEQASARGVSQTQDFGLALDGAEAAIRDVDVADVTLRARIAEMRQSLATAQADVNDVSAIVKMVDGWVHDFDDTLQGIQPETTGLTGSLRDLDGTIRDWRQLIGHLARYLDEFERDPVQTLLGKPSGGYRPH
jgi:phospholipid/cholesterol/gamma-HCH transport system substrate-binding protein